MIKTNEHSDNLLELRNVSLRERKPFPLCFFRKKNILESLSFKLKENESLGIMGDENSGKDILISLLAGMFNPTSGEMFFMDTLINNDTETRKSNMRMLFINTANALNPRMKVKDLLQIPLMLNYDLTEDERNERVWEILKLVDLTQDIAFKYPNTLSIGQRKRVALARALILNPRILLANKTMSSFDPLMRTYICSLFAKLKKERQISTIISTSDLDILSRTCDKLLIMNNGRMVEFGNTEEIINSSNDITRKLIANYHNEYRFKPRR